MVIAQVSIVVQLRRVCLSVCVSQTAPLSRRELRRRASSRVGNRVVLVTVYRSSCGFAARETTHRHALAPVAKQPDDDTLYRHKLSGNRQLDDRRRNQEPWSDCRTQTEDERRRTAHAASRKRKSPATSENVRGLFRHFWRRRRSQRSRNSLISRAIIPASVWIISDNSMMGNGKLR
nr:hypothetical protein [Burkholderia ubonensis]